jgi:hypothetical protein
MYILEQGNKQQLIDNKSLTTFFKIPEGKELESVVSWKLHASSFNDAGDDFTELVLMDAEGKNISKQRQTGY